MKKIAFSKKLLMTTVSATVLMNSQVLAEDSDSMDEIIVTDLTLFTLLFHFLQKG